MNIRLELMTKPLCRSFFEDFTYDPATFPDAQVPEIYRYDLKQADTFYEKNNQADRVHFAVMVDEVVVGDLYLKRIDRENRTCTLSIHMKNDSVKNRGYGTAAEILALEHAFNELRMDAVLADSLITNTRSRHVLEKVGFVMTGTDGQRCHYRCDKSGWSSCKPSVIDIV